MVINHLLTGMVLQVGRGFTHLFMFNPNYLGEMIQIDEHFFKQVETTR